MVPCGALLAHGAQWAHRAYGPTWAMGRLGPVGPIGQFIGRHPDRDDEHALHGAAVTTQRVQRWRSEENQQLVAEAQEVFERMPEYREFWDYED